LGGVRISKTSLAIGLAIFFGFLTYLQLVKRDPVSASSPAILRNSENEFLLTQPPAEQARWLGAASGKSCEGVDAFFMGQDTRKNASWSLRCSDGREFLITLVPAGMRSMIVMDCKVVRRLKTGTTCFAALHRR
jgi:hypothetical protein